MIGNVSDWEGLPVEPPDLATAVKDYLVWMKDSNLPLDHRFKCVKQRVVKLAIQVVERGSL